MKNYVTALWSHNVKAFWSFKSHSAICIINNRASSWNSSNQTSAWDRKDLHCTNFDSITASEETLPMIRNVSEEDPCICSRNKVELVRYLREVTFVLILLRVSNFSQINKAGRNNAYVWISGQMATKLSQRSKVMMNITLFDWHGLSFFTSHIR